MVGIMTARPRFSLPIAELPARPIPRIALREQEAADALGIGLTTFLSLVSEGKMPKPVRIRPRLPLYDAEDALAPVELARACYSPGHVSLLAL